MTRCADEKIREAGFEISNRRKWSATSAVKETESRLHHKEIVGAVAAGRQSIGCVTQEHGKPTGEKGTYSERSQTNDGGEEANTSGLNEEARQVDRLGRS